MPHLLRFDAIRLLEASQEALDLSVGSLGSAKRIEFRQSSAQFAIEVGLVGTAAEQAMAACLVQARGRKTIVWPSGKFKTASAILDEFVGLASDSTAASSFLTEGVSSPVEHRRALEEAARGFRRLITIRAIGLHAGHGLVHEAAVAQANSVASFLELLAVSRRLRPYLEKIPRCHWFGRERQIVIEDLAARLRAGADEDEATLLASIYLVLPEVPEQEPEWLDALSRVAVSPRQRDVQYLLDTLDRALPAALRRSKRPGATVPVHVDPDDAAAIPSAPHLLRRQLNEMSDLWHADIATANGRLEQGALDLPPLDAVLDVFAIGLQKAGVVAEDEGLNAHQTWPHIAASFEFGGTAGPYWFLVRQCSDLGQLGALLRRAATCRKRLGTRLEEALVGIDVLRKGNSIKRSAPPFGDLVVELDKAAAARGALMQRERQCRKSGRALPTELREFLENVAEGGEPVGTLLEALFAEERKNES